MLLNYAGESERPGGNDTTPIRLTTSKQRFDSGLARGRVMSKRRRGAVRLLPDRLNGAATSCWRLEIRLEAQPIRRHLFWCMRATAVSAT